MPDKRRNSLLTDGQRRFLESDKSGYHRQTQKDYKDALREQVPEGIRDATILWENWDKTDENARRETFDENIDDPEFQTAIANLIALLYSGAGEGLFKNLLQRGVRKAEHRSAKNELNDVMVEFSVDPVQRIYVEDALSRYERRGEFTDLADSELATIAKLLRRYEGQEAADKARQAWEQKRENLNLEHNPSDGEE